MPDGFIPDHGGYRKLLSFKKAEILFDGTHIFVKRFLKPGDRTIDQMIQAARSGKQNIVEASMASGTSKETEVKLLNVARSSQEELLSDYLDYLRVRIQDPWDKESEQALYVRKLGSGKGPKPETIETYREFLETRSDIVVANIMICLIHQASYLLDRQIARVEQNFLEEGGIRERMTKARLEVRGKQRQQNNKKQNDNGEEER